jgi:hypothetical protein
MTLPPVLDSDYGFSGRVQFDHVRDVRCSTRTACIGEDAPRTALSARFSTSTLSLRSSPEGGGASADEYITATWARELREGDDRTHLSG